MKEILKEILKENARTTAPAINVPAHLLRALCAAAETLCETANWYPSDRSDCFEMIVLAERVATLRAAIASLKEAGAIPQPAQRNRRVAQ